jgi:ubiquitin-conjugating enzyme E2 G1
MALKRLQSEFVQLTKDPNYFFSINPSEDNFFKWDIMIIGPPDTPFEGGIIHSVMEFTKEYPNRPPTFQFISKLFHPNVYADGKVCISILHEGVDEFNYESVSERWNPSHSVNSILMSIISMLSSPNFESPANIDASKMWRDNFNEYKKIIYQMVSKSQ